MSHRPPVRGSTTRSWSPSPTCPAPVEREALREVVDRRILVAAGGSADPHYVFSPRAAPGGHPRRAASRASVRVSTRGYAAALEARAADRAAGRPTDGPVAVGRRARLPLGCRRRRAAGSGPTIEAASAAERGYAFLEAHRRYLRALELWDRVEPLDGDGAPLTASTSSFACAETAVMIGEYRSAVDLGRQALDGVDAAADPARAGALHERQRWYLWEAGDRVAAEAAVVEAERLVPAQPPSASRARILAHHAGILMLNGRFAESLPMAEEALTVARSVDSPSDEALALGIIGWDLALLGRVDEGVERVRDGLAIAAALGGAEGIALGATNLAVLLDRVGRTEEALDVATAGLGARAGAGCRADVRRAAARDRRQGRDRARAVGRGGFVPGHGTRPPTDRCVRDPPAHPARPARHVPRRPRVGRGGPRRRPGRRRGGRRHRGSSRPAGRARRARGDQLATWGRPGRTSMAGFGLASGGLPDPALAALAATGLRVEADAAARARTRHDETGLEEARRRAGAIAEQVERIAAVLGVPATAADPSVEPSRQAVLATLCRAEARRVDERDEATPWLSVAGGFDAIGRPYPAAYARFRAAAATLRDRGARAGAQVALADARATAARLGAQPLLTEIDLLARHGRLEIEQRRRP